MLSLATVTAAGPKASTFRSGRGSSRQGRPLKRTQPFVAAAARRPDEEKQGGLAGGAADGARKALAAALLSSALLIAGGSLIDVRWTLHRSSRARIVGPRAWVVPARAPGCNLPRLLTPAGQWSAARAMQHAASQLSALATGEITCILGSSPTLHAVVPLECSTAAMYAPLTTPL